MSSFRTFADSAAAVHPPTLGEVSQENVLPAFAEPRRYMWTNGGLKTRGLTQRLSHLRDSNDTWERNSKRAWTRSRTLKLDQLIGRRGLEYPGQRVRYVE
jgi:hypothetical protein